MEAWEDHLLKESRRLLEPSWRPLESQLETWEAPLGSSWGCLGGAKTSSGELLEASWKLPEPTWRPLASLRSLLGALGIVLEASWELLERS